MIGWTVCQFDYLIDLYISMQFYKDVKLLVSLKYVNSSINLAQFTLLYINVYLSFKSWQTAGVGGPARTLGIYNLN